MDEDGTPWGGGQQALDPRKFPPNIRGGGGAQGRPWRGKVLQADVTGALHFPAELHLRHYGQDCAVV